MTIKEEIEKVVIAIIKQKYSVEIYDEVLDRDGSPLWGLFIYGCNGGIKISTEVLKHFIGTVIHEYLHGLYPKKREKTILALEQKLMSNIDYQQARAIVRVFIKKKFIAKHKRKGAV